MKSRAFLVLYLVAGTTLAQTAPSDSLFNTEQVVTVNLSFGDPNFWSTLTAFYSNDQGQTLTGDVTITDNTGTRTYPNVAVDLKGNSSYGHPGNKKSFKIDFNDNVPGQKYHGMTKMHFNNCFKDPTFMREKVFFDFAREQGVLAPRVLWANVTINGTFWGFYNMVEPVDKNFLDRWVDDNNGNLFKAGDQFGSSGATTAADLAYYGTAQSGYIARYELKTNETENDWSDLIALLQMLNTSPDADLVAQFPGQWEWAPMLRSLAIDNLFSNLDSYINSARNYYIYHDSTTFRWNWIKWDANEAFGSYTGGPESGSLLTLAPNYMAASRPLLTKVFGRPELYSDYRVEYCNVFDAFSNALLDVRIDANKSLIEAHVAADPNKQFTTAQFTANIANDVTVSGGGPGGQQTIRGLKSFISARRSYLANALDCSQVGIAEQDVEGQILVFPVPAGDILNIRTPVGTSLKELRILDGLGRSVPVQTNNNELDVSGLDPGVYFISIPVSGTIRTARFVKE